MARDASGSARVEEKISKRKVYVYFEQKALKRSGHKKYETTSVAEIGHYEGIFYDENISLTK